jgi:hypothetical protein
VITIADRRTPGAAVPRPAHRAACDLAVGGAGPAPGGAFPEGHQRSGQQLTWPGGIHLLGAGILIIPGRTLDNPEDARAHAAAVLAATARMEAARS